LPKIGKPKDAQESIAVFKEKENAPMEKQLNNSIAGCEV
jgi:hypothetical protein